MPDYNFEDLEHAFFHPFVGKKYKDGTGVNGKRVLVIGDSFYCNGEECEFYEKCTDTQNKSSKEYDTSCPERIKHRNENGIVTPLHDEPEVAITEYDSYAYQNFKSFLKLFVNGDENAWDYVAFTNYIQFFLPGYRTNGAFIDKKNYRAFEEVVSCLKPDVVVTWGNAVADSIRNTYEHEVKSIQTELKNSQYYLAHLTINEHKFTMVYLYHPSSRIWASDIYNSYKYFKKALEEK